MLITKIFNVESSHRVINCSSERCKYSLHGHSAKIELTLSAPKPDNGGMVYDFGLMKGTIKEFIDSMDHCNLFYSLDDRNYTEFIKRFNDRWIELPVSPSAEFLAAFIFKSVQFILDHTITNNGESKIKVYSVKYHETASGSATCFEEDVDEWAKYDLDDVVVSPGVQNDWSEGLKSIMFRDGMFANPVVEQQEKCNW